MSKKRLKVLLVIFAILAILATYLVINWYNDTHTGPRSGKVIDAITGKPIEGAVVKCSWVFWGFLGRAIGGNGYISREVLTDSNGQYYIPDIYQKKSIFLDSGFGEDERLLVYKDGYDVYTTYSEYRKPTVGRAFAYYDIQKYSKKNNVIKLYLFKEGVSHEKHIFWIDGYTRGFGETELLGKELDKERERARKEP
jgi:hypothetical protein